MENPKIENRQKVANIVLADKKLFKHLITIIFTIDDKLSIKAAWILEWICTHHHLTWILPYLDEFTKKIATLKFDSAIRPCAKICAQLAEAYHLKKNKDVLKTITKAHVTVFIETGFDWLITPQKIAVRAYAMTFLYYWGLDTDWVHPELKHLIQSKIINESKGCKARGKAILEMIEKSQNSAL